MTIERYRLTLEHEYINDNGKVYKIEDPIRTEYSVVVDGIAPQKAIIVNEMIEKLKHFMLHSINRRAET